MRFPPCRVPSRTPALEVGQARVPAAEERETAEVGLARAVAGLEAAAS